MVDFFKIHTCNGLQSRWCYPCFEFSTSNGKSSMSFLFPLIFFFSASASVRPLSASRGERWRFRNGHLLAQQSFSVLPTSPSVPKPWNLSFSPFQPLFKSIPNPCLVLQFTLKGQFAALIPPLRTCKDMTINLLEQLQGQLTHIPTLPFWI